MVRLLKFALVLALVLLSLTGLAVAQDEMRPYRIVVVTHGQASDPF